MHLSNTASKETTESTSRGRSGEEDSHTETAFVTTIPHGDVVGDTGEETTLSETESHTSDKKTGIVGDETHEGSANSPDKHDDGNPNGRGSALHHQVGRNFGGDVEREEHSKGNLHPSQQSSDTNYSGDRTHIVVETLHSKIFFETSETSVTDVCSVEERETGNIVSALVIPE